LEIQPSSPFISLAQHLLFDGRMTSGHAQYYRAEQIGKSVRPNRRKDHKNGNDIDQAVKAVA
jgi:hypothetical protein